MELQYKSLWIDVTRWHGSIKVDDFLAAIGKNKSNSIYHVAEVTRIEDKHYGRVKRYHLKVLKSDLITAISRECDQNIMPFTWNYR